MSQSQVKKHYPEIDIARGIGIILVVLGHTFPDASLEGGVQLSVWRFVFNYIYSFHMPLFVFLAGFVTNKTYPTIKDKYNRIIKRALRLLLPYITWSIIYIPLRIVLSSISSSPFELNGLWRIAIGESPYSGLWFLYALFIIDTLRTLISRTERMDMIMLPVSLILLVVGKLATISEPLNWVFYYFFFYYGGIIVRRYFDTLSKHISNWCAIICSSIVLFAVNFLFPRGDDLAYRLMSIVTAIAGIVMVMSVSLKIKTNNLLEKLGIYSMDIYILSGPVLVLLRTVLYYRMNCTYSLYIPIALILSILISLFVSILIIRKNRYLSLILIGEKA